MYRYSYHSHLEIASLSLGTRVVRRAVSDKCKNRVSPVREILRWLRTPAWKAINDPSYYHLDGRAAGAVERWERARLDLITRRDNVHILASRYSTVQGCGMVQL